MSLLRYSVTVQFDVKAGDTITLDTKLDVLSEVGEIVNIKAKSAGKGKGEKKAEVESE